MSKKIRINANLTEPMYEKLKCISQDTGFTMSVLVTMAVMNYIDQRDAFALNDLYKRLEAEQKSKQ